MIATMPVPPMTAGAADCSYFPTRAGAVRTAFLRFRSHSTPSRLGESIGPSNARVVVRSGAEVLFDESFDALEYGEGREINGPGCGRCYGPVIFERSLQPPSIVDGSAPPDAS